MTGPCIPDNSVQGLYRGECNYEPVILKDCKLRILEIPLLVVIGLVCNVALVMSSKSSNVSNSRGKI